MIFQHNALFAASVTNREATHAIGVYLAAGFNLYVELLGLDGRELAGDVRKGVEGDWLRLFLCGTGAFAILGEVSSEGLH